MFSLLIPWFWISSMMLFSKDVFPHLRSPTITFMKSVPMIWRIWSRYISRLIICSTLNDITYINIILLQYIMLSIESIVNFLIKNDFYINHYSKIYLRLLSTGGFLLIISSYSSWEHMVNISPFGYAIILRASNEGLNL